MTAPRKKLAVFKFASCDGCQLSLLDCEDELLLVAEHLQISYFREATSSVIPGPWDLTLVEGSVTTADDIQRIKQVREQSRYLVTIGACATAGGIQALRNYRDVNEFIKIVYARPEYIDCLDTSDPIAAHVPVDYELRGCPINKHQLLEVITAFLTGKAPAISSHSVCAECKMRQTPCLLVSKGTPCLGPVTHAGCDALCPSYGRGCFGCYGPAGTTNPTALSARLLKEGMTPTELQHLYQSFNAAAPA